MELSNIKRGDILVEQCDKTKVDNMMARSTMVFIAENQPTFSNFGADLGDSWYDIPTLAAILLDDSFMINTEIGINVSSDSIRKPTIKEFMDIMNRLKKNGFRYNKKTKNIENYESNK